ncbi:toll/interleukin-1 receptor domain-containing protein [Streptomyces albus]|uniref:toll/interleukin-1 receptor domain-containing protein n=1 Tax=Streptomyces albus TaxID=1888 RepID=UPI00345600BA
MFLPLLGPRVALVTLLIPFGVFFPAPPLVSPRQLWKGGVTLEWSWRRLVRPHTLALPLALTVLCGGTFAVTSSGHPAFWIALVGLPVGLITCVVNGAVAYRAQGAPVGPARTSSGLHVVRPVPLAVAALLTAVVSGAFAWVVRDRVRELLAGTGPTVTRRVEDVVSWTDAQLAASVFGPTYDRQWYWVLLVCAAGLLAAGCCLLLRNAHVRVSTETAPFQEAPGAYGVRAESTSKVFLSYSRKDTGYARRLSARLEGRLGELWVDWQAIRPSEEWRKSIAEAIRTSDAFVVLLSRDALMSTYCWDECRQAIEQRKRILPVVIDPELERGSTSGLMRERGWGELTAYQNLSLTDPDEAELDQGVEDIVAFVHQHYQWVAFHARLGVLAHQWWEGGRREGQLLRADELSVAEAWQRNAPDEERFHAGLTERQKRYVEESRRFVRRRAFRTRAALAAGTAAVVGLSGLVAVEQTAAEVQYRSALSRKLAALSRDAFGPNPERAVQYALAARAQADTAEARNAVAERLADLNPVRTVVAPRAESVDRVLLSREGDLLFIERGGTTEVWDVKRARSRGMLPGSLLSDSAPPPPLPADGRTVALGDMGRVDLVDTRTLRVKDSFSAAELGSRTGPILEGGQLSTDGRRLLATVDTSTVLWDVRRHRVVGKADCMDAAMAPSGRVAVCRDGRILERRDTDGAQDKALRKIRSVGGDIVGFTDHDGVLANVAREARVYERGSAHPWVPAPGMAAVSSTYHGDGPLLGGRYVVLNEYGKERYELWDLLDRRRLGSANSVEKALDLRRGGDAPGLQRAKPISEAETSDGSLVATAAVDGSVVLWRKDGSGRISKRLPVPTKQGFFGASPDGRTVASVSGRRVRLWDTGRRERTGYFPLSAPGGFSSFSRDGSLLAVAEGLGEGRLDVEVFRVRNGRRVSRFEAGKDERNHIASLMFSPDGKKLYAALTGQFRVVAWKVADSGGKPRTVARTDGFADHAALSPDGKRLTATGRNGTVSLWDTASGTRLRVFREASYAAFSPDGKTLAVADPRGRSVSLRDVENGKKAGPDLVPDGQASRMRFSPDGRRLAIIGGPEGGQASRLQVSLWDLRSRQQVGPPLATVDAWAALEFTADGEHVVAAGRYGTTVTAVAANAWVSSLCSTVTRQLSSTEWQDVAPGERFRWPC